MKKKLLRVIALVCMTTLLATSLIACGGKEETEPTSTGSVNTEVGGEVAVDEWTIPVLSAVTGPIAYVGKPASWAAEYAVEVINASGGINGVPVSVEIHDTKFDTAEVASALSLVVDDALVVVGPMDAPGGEVAGQMIYDAAVPNIGAYSYQDSRDAYMPYAIAYMADSEEGDVLAAQKWIELNPDIKSVVLFTCPSDASQVNSVKQLEAALPKLGVEVVGIVEIETDTLDCGPAAVQALNYDADGYYSVLRADESAKIVSELRTRGVDEGRRIAVTFAAYSDNYISVAGAEALDGTYVWNKLDPNYEGEEWNTLVEAYKEDFAGAAPNVNPVPDFYNALIAIKQCFEELKITGDPENAEAEKKAIAEWFNNSPTIHGIQGDFHWENGKKISNVYFFQFDGTTPTVVE